MNDKTKQIQTILFLGALWGIAEATIGHILHFLPCGFSGMFMFPIGFYFMYNAFRQTEQTNAVWLTGIVAASIKFVDFILPMRSPMSVLNPAMSIMLESLVVFGFIKYFEGEKSFIKTISLGFSWVILFTLAQALIFRPASGLYLYPAEQMLFYNILNGLMSGSLIYLYLKKEDFAAWKPSISKPSYLMPVTMILIAIAMEIGNSVVF